jgi:hypothetical protein
MPQRHDRRRLLYTEDSPTSGSNSSDEPPIRIAVDSDLDQGPEPSRRTYAAAAHLHRQRRVHDLLPARYLTIGLVSTAGVLLVGGIELLHVWAGSWGRFLSPQETAALDMTAPRNISQWFASMLLGVASLIAISIYLLRRHRVDDYHGRYRVWIWTAVACLMASLGETTDAVLLAQGISRRAGSACGLADGVVWPSVLAIVLVVLGIRMFLEVRACLAALATLSLAAVAFIAAAAMDLGWLVSLSDHAKPLVARGCWLAGYVLILATFLMVARHVLLEVEGVIVRPFKAKRHKAKRPPETNSDASPTPAPHFRIDLELLPPSSNAASSSSRSQLGANKPQATSSNGLAGRVLSRAEHRRLRKEANA